MGRTRTSETPESHGTFDRVSNSVAPFMELRQTAREGIVVRGESTGSGCVRLGVSGIQMGMGQAVIQRGGPLQSMDGAFLPPQFRGVGYEEERSVVRRAKDSCVTRVGVATKMFVEPARVVRAKSFTLGSARVPWRVVAKICTAPRTLA